ncbi:MAG: TonB-dependent receptor [Bacteroides sp.]|nr:TonB-dependent receptor [Bacteroides sp.]
MCVAMACGTSLSAQDRELRYSLSFREATLEEFVKIMENATGLSFVYGEDVQINRRIMLEARRLTVHEILERAFVDQPVRYELSGRHILLNKRQPLQKPVSRQFTISGYVTDGVSSETLIGSNVFESRRSTGTATNPYGFYSLTLPEGDICLNVSYLGYELWQSSFCLRQDTVLNIRLKSHNQLSEVVVTGDKKEVGLRSTTMGSHDIPIAQIKSTPTILGEADLVKTIQLMPGVQAGMEGFAGLYVRGGSPDQNLVMLDGIPVYNADHLLGIFSVFTPEAVKNVTLFKSSFPARHGGRLSSVIDVRTNDGDLHRYHGSIGVGVVTEKLHLEGPLWKDRTSFSLSARVTPTIFFRHFTIDQSDGSDRDEDKYNYYFYDLNAKLSHILDERNRLFAGFYRGKDHYRYTNLYYAYSDGITSEDYDKTRLSWGNLIAYARWNHVFSNRLFSDLTFSYNEYRMALNETVSTTHIETNETPDTETYYSHFRSGIRDFALRMAFDYMPQPKHRIKFGAEAIRHTFHPGVSTSKLQETVRGEVSTDTVYNTYSNQVMHGYELSVYGEDLWEVSKRLQLNIGLRAMLFHTQGKYYPSLQPRITVRYSLSEKLAVKASYSYMAQYIHLLSTTPFSMPTDLWVPITRNIRPMNAHQYALGGYLSDGNGWEFSIEGYYKQMNHVLEYQEGMSFFGNSTHWEDKVEMGEARSYGVELMAQKTVGKTSGWLAYTLSKTERRFKEGTISQGEWFPYKYDRRHNISLCLNHKFSDRIDVGASWVFYTGGCITVPERSTVTLTPDGYLEERSYISHRNNYRLPVTHRLNLSINFNKKTKHGMRTWNISVYNAYNALNPNLVYSERQGEQIPIYDENGEQIGSKAKEKTVIKKLTFLPFIPSVTYTYRF